MPPASRWPALVPGPHTITWRRAGDVRVLLAAGYALLLQVSHPTVGAGVSEHSQFRLDPWGRLLRTLDYTSTMVYGGPTAAGEMGARIRALHRQIKGVRADGQRYTALEPGAYAWVHATLAEAMVLAHERFGIAFTDAQKEELWGEWRELGALLGVRPRDLPADWGAFRVYFATMVERELEHTAAVDEVLAALGRPQPPSLPPPLRAAWGALAGAQLGRALTLTTVGLLPALLRERFGVPFTRAHQLQLGALAGALRAATPLMPAALRNTGPGYLRWRAEALARADGQAANAARVAAAPAAARSVKR